MLFLCLTRWDLLFDLVLLQTQVTTGTGQTLKDCNAIISRAKRHNSQGLVYHPLPGTHRKLAAIADSSHASKKSSYAFEGNLVLLQSETSATPQCTGDYNTTVPATKVAGICAHVHPLHPKSQNVKPKHEPRGNAVTTQLYSRGRVCRHALH